MSKRLSMKQGERKFISTITGSTVFELVRLPNQHRKHMYKYRRLEQEFPKLALHVSNEYIQALLSLQYKMTELKDVTEEYKKKEAVVHSVPTITTNEWFKALKSGKTDAMCFSTNLSVTPKGNAVVGAGLAKQVQETFIKMGLNIKQVLGKKLQSRPILRKDASVNKKMQVKFNIHKHSCDHLAEVKIKGKQTDIYSFPVKEGWWEHARVSLITESCRNMVKIADEKGYQVVVMNFPGIGNGKLSGKFLELKKLLMKELDNRFYIFMKENNYEDQKA